MLKVSTKFLPKGKYFGFPNIENFKYLFDVSSFKHRKLSLSFFKPKGKKGWVWKGIRLAFPFFQLAMKSKIINVKENGEYYNSIKELFGGEVRITTYSSTDKDKLVLRVIKDYKVVGFLKIGLNELGNKHLLQEKIGWKKVKELGFNSIVESELAFDEHTALVLKVVEGDELTVDQGIPKNILDQFSYDKRINLNEHPRYLNLSNDFPDLDLGLEAYYMNSGIEFGLCFEHGDFSPWNIIKSRESLQIIDLEFSEVNGIEGMDEIKYIYCIERYVNNLNSTELVSKLQQSLNPDLAKYILPLFLVKEIRYRKEMSHDFNYELEALKNTLT